VALGAVLFLVATGYHLREAAALGDVAGPLAALLLDGLPALAVVAIGVHLGRTDLAPRDQRRVLAWSLGGGVVFLSVIWTTFLVRFAEGRTVAEPAFPLLIGVNVGALAGLVAGYYHARSRADARRARAVSDALSFVNDLLRHDLRNDLAVIAGNADLLADRRTAADGDDPGDVEVVATKADEALDRIETTRAVTGVLVGDPTLEPTDLAAVVADLAAGVASIHDAAVTTDLPDRALVRANDGLRSVVDNLLENAVEHNDADDPRVTAAVTVDPEAVRLTVSDNGPGLSGGPESPFDASRTETDRGGLALVQTLVEGYGGTVRAEPNEPRGATVVVTLPRAEPEG
jgi:hypothetical protein